MFRLLRWIEIRSLHLVLFSINVLDIGVHFLSKMSDYSENSPTW